MEEAAMKSTLFLQVIMHKEILSDYEMANESFFQFDDRNYIRHITELNQKLAPLNLAIQSGIDELTGEKFWAFSPTIRDDKMTFQSKFTQPQLDLLRTIFIKILESEDGWISSIDAINLGSELETRITPTEVERTIAMMVESKWLSAKEGNIFIGARSIIELMPFLRDCHDGDFYVCPICSLSVFHGLRCDNCQNVTHLYCLAKLHKMLGQLDCFKCKHPLDIEAADLPNVEDADASGTNQHDDEAESPPARRPKGTKRKHR